MEVAKRRIKKLRDGDPLTQNHQRTRIFRKLGPERSEVAIRILILILLQQFWGVDALRNLAPLSQ